MRNISKCKARKVKDIENRHFYIEKWTLKVSISSVDLNFLHDMGEKSTFFPSSVEKAITFVGVFRKVFTAPNVKNTKHFAIVKLCKFEISPPYPCSRRRGLMFMGAGVLAVLIGIIITVTTIYQANHGKAGFYAIYISE